MRTDLAHSAVLSKRYRDRLALHSLPTRRSSDLREERAAAVCRSWPEARRRPGTRFDTGGRARFPQDRKSTRLNSSHLVISYAVFCLKKKMEDEVNKVTGGRKTAGALAAQQDGRE